MKKFLFPLVFLLAAPLYAQPIERRCGWLNNPTPANWFLVDRAAAWDIGIQGGFQARGIEKINLQNERDYVRTNGNYGYGCACMDVTTTRSGGTWRITSIRSFRQLPLKQCLEDPDLPKL